MRLSCGFALLLAAVPHVIGQKVYLAGDSTMAKGTAGSAIDGWGQYLAQYLTIPVVNNAVSGRSARSYTDEGRFTTLINAAKAGDFVVIEFGHNDGSSNPDNGRTSAVGEGYNTTAIITEPDGSTLLIHSFPYYVQNAVTALQAKGAIPIVSSQTPNNGWTGSVISPGPRFVGYMQIIGTRTGAVYIDHYAYTADAYNKLGQTKVTTYFPNDHTHTSPTGANIVAQTFVRGLLCGQSALKQKVSAAGMAVPNGCV